MAYTISLTPQVPDAPATLDEAKACADAVFANVPEPFSGTDYNIIITDSSGRIVARHFPAGKWQ